MLSPILALFARISKPLWLNIRSTGAEVAGGQKTFSSNGCSTLYVSLRATSTQGSEFGVRGVVTYSRYSITTDRRFICSTVSSPKTETETGGFQDQYRDQDFEVPRPRPRLRGFKTETKTCKNGSQDVSRPRLKSRELQVWFYLMIV